MKLIYQGPHDAVDVPEHGVFDIARGEQVDVPASAVEDLLAAGFVKAVKSKDEE